MFTDDCTEIAKHGTNSPDGLVDIVEFTLCTIQAGLHGTWKQRQDIAKTGLKSRFLWGQKAQGLAYARKHKERLWSKACAILETQGKDSVEGITEAILLFNKIPNIGMVKAGFICQMLGFNTACLDSHNLKACGFPIKDTSLPKSLSAGFKAARVKRYVEFTQEKGSEYWWDSWCNHVAGNRANKDLDTGEKVSRFHVHVVKIHSK